MELIPYRSERQAEWDSFIRNSKNGTFLFYRSFMDYHKDRFTDLSLMFYHKSRLLGAIPGNLSGDTFYTHAGLTYGGLVMSRAIKMNVMIDIFLLLAEYLRKNGIKKIVYKPVPHIYHKYPSEEDLYALFRMKATLIERNISSSILLSDKMEYSKLRKRGIKKAKKNNIYISETKRTELFWPILEKNLQVKYQVAPIHTLGEINNLKVLFADEIRLYGAFTHDDTIIAGCLVFVTDMVVHVQYVAANEEGKAVGAVDLLINHIICTYSDKKYFDYGISTQNGGRYLNTNLINQKEGFGARGIVYDVYSVDL